MVIAVDDAGVAVEVLHTVEEEEVIAVGVVGVGLFDSIDCLNARGAVGGVTPVPRAAGGGVGTEDGCWRYGGEALKDLG